MDLTQLVQAILSRVREREGFVTKTKLVKYLYLLDVEAYRHTGRTVTGFRWFFHLYGPWAREFEDLYASLRSRNAIEISGGTRADLDTEFVMTSRQVELGDLIADPTLELAVRHAIDRWADRRTGELLDYVYFHTEPMLDAERGAMLDFSRVTREGRLSFDEAMHCDRPDRSLVERMRRAIAARTAETDVTTDDRTLPVYDEHYFEALHVMEQDDAD